MKLDIRYGDAPVPWTVSWSGEASYSIEQDYLFDGALAVQQIEGRGGVPRFGVPHYNRQRRAMLLGLCDLCARPLRMASKYSLSHGAVGPGLHMEPMLHAECARICLAAQKGCPALRRQAEAGELRIRRVLQCSTHLMSYPADRIPAEIGVDYRGVSPVVGMVGLRIDLARDEPVEVWLRQAMAA